MKKKYILGIDLGTTNSTLSYSVEGDDEKAIHQFAIPQIVASGVQGEAFSLPSFLYIPLEDENLSEIAIDWAKNSHNF